MSLSYVTLTGTIPGSGTASVRLSPSNWLTDPADELLIPPAPVSVYCNPVTNTFSVSLLATDNAAPTPSGWYWTVTISGIPGVGFETFSFFLPADPYSFTATDASPCVFTASGSSYADGTPVVLTGAGLPAGFTAGTNYYVVSASGDTFELAATSGGSPIRSTSTGSGTVATATTDISTVAQLSPVPDVLSYLPVPSGTPGAGQVPVATGTGQASDWATLTAADVGADAEGAAAAAQANAETYAAAQAAAAQSAAETFATSAVATETSRAEAAEALLAPKASPALTGTPTAPTAAALTGSTQVATTAYADAAVAVETSRAETAEALLLPLPSGTPALGQVPVFTGSGEESAAGSPPYVGLAPSGDTTGATDIANIAGLYNLGAKQVILQEGVFYTNTVLPVPAGAILRGTRGTGPTIYDQWPLTTGTIIRAVAAWSAGSYSTPAIVEATGYGVHLRDFWVDGSNLWSGSTPVTTCDGVNDGNFGARSVNICNVGVHMSTGNGFTQGGSEWVIFQCCANVTYGDGFHGYWTDSQLTGCFAQACGFNGSGSGYAILGSQCKFVGCRGDLSQYGFYVSGSTSSTYSDMVQLIGCSTQRNNKEGLHVSDSGTGCPVMVSGCVFDGDGINGTLSMSGGTPAGSGYISGGTGLGHASINIGGACTVILSGVSTTCGTRDASSPCPQYAISTYTNEFTAPGQPKLIELNNAFLNCGSQFINDTAPAAIFSIGPNCYGYAGGVYGSATTPVQITPSVVPAASLPAATTSAQGAVEFDGTASDIQPAGQSAVAGSSGKVPDAKHIHPPGSGFLCTPTQYAPSSSVVIQTLSGTYASMNAAATSVASGSNGGEISAIASWSSPSAGVLDVGSTAGWPTSGTVNVGASGSTTAVVTYTGVTATSLTGCAYVSGSPTGTVGTGGAVTLADAGSTSGVPSISTGSFTAPASGSVVVTATFSATSASSGHVSGFALAAHGTTSPLVGAPQVTKFFGAWTQCNLQFLVTGLTPGNTYNFDLMFATGGASNLAVYAFAQTSTSVTDGNNGVGAPVTLTVQAV